MSDQPDNRDLTSDERQLVLWMLEHGNHQARAFLPQVDQVRISPWRCECGCASVDFIQEKQAEPTAGMRILGDYVFGGGDHESGMFIFERGGILSGIEVYGLGGDAARSLPHPVECRPFGAESECFFTLGWKQ